MIPEVIAALQGVLTQTEPVLVFLAGSNGAGKSTFFKDYLQPLGLPFINADEIARVLRETSLPAGTEDLDRLAFEKAEELRLSMLTGRLSFCTETAGHEPVREWIKALKQEDRKAIGQDVKTAQYGWPLGMPLIRKLAPGLWEIRSQMTQGIARVIFTVEDGLMVLLHAFVKKSQKTPPEELRTARQRLARLHEEKA